MKREDVMREISALQAELVQESIRDLCCVGCRGSAAACPCGEDWDSWTLAAWNRTLWAAGAARLEALLRRAWAADWRPANVGEISCPTCGVPPFLPCLGPWLGEEPFTEVHKARSLAWTTWRPPRLGQMGLGDFAPLDATRGARPDYP
jgi:hypothetical protein